MAKKQTVEIKEEIVDDGLKIGDKVQGVARCYSLSMWGQILDLTTDTVTVRERYTNNQFKLVRSSINQISDKYPDER